MKKVFAILAVAGFLAACNNSTETKVSIADSTRMADSAKAAMSSAAMDTAKKALDTAKAAMDTAKKKM